MRKTRRLSQPAADVLELFVDQPDDELWGRRVIELTGIPSGSLYPILHTLVERRHLVAMWEPMDEAAEAARRPRRLYRLNPDSASAETARQAISEARSTKRRERINLAPRPASS